MEYKIVPNAFGPEPKASANGKVRAAFATLNVVDQDGDVLLPCALQNASVTGQEAAAA